jgi:hypothetical protein
MIMETTPSKPDYGQPYKAPTPTKERNTKSHYRRRGHYFSVIPENLVQNFQIHPFRIFQSSEGFVHIFSGREEEEESVIPENQRQDRPLPVRKEQIKESNKEDLEKDKEKGKEEAKKDDSIIEDPTGELDDPYKSGHADRDQSPPIEKDSVDKDPKKNTKTKK